MLLGCSRAREMAVRFANDRIHPSLRKGQAGRPELRARPIGLRARPIGLS